MTEAARVNVIVNYEYGASEPDELTLRVGDVVRDVERLAGGWWRGELRGRRGMFPDNFVTVCEPVSPLMRNEGPTGRCKAVFSYQPANPDELSLAVGDTLEVLGEVEEGWWQGRTKQGKVGVFPSNFVVLMDRPVSTRPLSEEAPRLPPKPVKEQCRVLFPYTAMNEDELTLQEGDVVNIISKDGPDRGWWRGELRGRAGLFPDNFVVVIPTPSIEVEEKKPERPPTAKSIYPVLNKYSEKTMTTKELTTSKTSLHKESTTGKETTAHKDTTTTHIVKSEQERISFSETVKHTDESPEGKKPPVPAKKSPTPGGGVGGLFSGLKSKIISSSDKEKSATVSSSTSSSSGEWDRLDGGAPSKSAPAAGDGGTLDRVERNSLLSDPRAGRVKAPRRRPPSQALRDDAAPQPALSNGQHAEAPAEQRTEPLKPKAREWEKHKAPWMEELKLNQAKKTSFVSDKSRSVSSTDKGEVAGPARHAGTGSTDKLLECGAGERKLEMSKSMSSITSRLSTVETFDTFDTFEESTKTRHSLDSARAETSPVPPPPTSAVPGAAPSTTLHSPTAAGRTLTTMLEEIKKPPAPAPPVAGSRTSTDLSKVLPLEKSTSVEKTIPTEKTIPVERVSVTERNSVFSDKTNVAERNSVHLDKVKPAERNSVHLDKENPVERNSVHLDKVNPAERNSVHLDKVNPAERNSVHLDKVNPAERNSVHLDKENPVERNSVHLDKVNPAERNSVHLDKENPADRNSVHLDKVNVVERNSDRVIVAERNSTYGDKQRRESETIAQLNDRICDLERLLESTTAKFTAAIEQLTAKLSAETEQRKALQSRVDKLQHCVTSV